MTAETAPGLPESVSDEQIAADVAELNANGGTRINTRDEHGVIQPLTRETIHTLAEIVRCLRQRMQSR